MAAAEARAAWPRMANRCFVQEDAKRAPKLAYCQSSSSASKQVDAGSTNTVEELDHPALCFMPLDRNSFSSNLPPDTRWWLQWHPSYGYQETPEAVGCPLHKPTSQFYLDPESPLIGCDRSEPWWRTTDKDEFVSLVLKKSQVHIKNFDLPPSQKIVDQDEALASSFNWKVQTGDISNWNDAQGCPDSGKTHGNQGTLSEEGYSLLGSNKSFSYCRNHKDTQFSDVDPGKVELMEALSHSQTRASEAETTVKWRKSWHRTTKGKRVKGRKPRHTNTKYAVVFALGLSFVGAGSLGLDFVGWMLPSF
ncbi:hypothetical protein I3843_05G203900 [Carya illinoinensis]|nr:hypothetical protein I3843_05G203900 [Carya illinoinensis]